MPLVDVLCPSCGAKLKAPDNLIGKKAKCKKCRSSFRIPGGSANSASTTPPAFTSPLSLDDDDDDKTELMVVDQVDDATTRLPIPPATPVPAAGKDLTSLPSADPFDFSKPPTQAKVASKSTPPPPAKATSAKPATPSPASKTPAKPATTPPPAASTPAAPATASKSAGRPITPPHALPIDDLLPAEKPKAAPAEPNNPFAFTDTAEGEQPAKGKKPRDQDEDEEPALRKKKKQGEGDDEPAPTKKKKSGDDEPVSRKSRREEEDEDEAPRKKKKPRDDAAEAERPAKANAAPSAADEPYNPFADYAAATDPQKPEKNPKRRGDPEDEPKARKKRDPDEDDQQDDDELKPRYRRPVGKRGMGMTIVITALVGMVALGLGITAIVVFVMQNKKQPEQAKQEKKEQPPAPPAGTGGEQQPPPKDPEPKRKGKAIEPKPKENGPAAAPVPGPKSLRPALALTKLKTFSVEGAPIKTQLADKPRGPGMIVETAFKNVKRVFPPFDATADTHVLFELAPGAGGKGEKLALDSYGPAGNRVATARIEYEGDGYATPIADVSASAAGTYFLAATGGKLHVWSIDKNNKLADGVNPYADKPEHAKSGLAAAFFAADPKQIVLVSTAGDVLLYDLPSRKPVSEFLPPNRVPGRVSLGKSVAKAEGGGSLGIAVAGVLYQLKSAPRLEVVRQSDLGGDVRNSLGLALSGTPGRILYTFDTLADKTYTSTTAIVSLPLGDDPKPIFYRFPSIGAAKGALWANESAGGVIAAGGVLLFDDSENGKFLPQVMIRPVSGGLYYGDSTSLWYLIPHPKQPAKSMWLSLSLPFSGFTEFHQRFVDGKPLRSAMIDGNGLSK